MGVTVRCYIATAIGTAKAMHGCATHGKRQVRRRIKCAWSWLTGCGMQDAVRPEN